MTTFFTGIDHFCIATRDLHRVVRTWTEGYGVGPWQVFEYDDTSMTATYCGVAGALPMRAALTAFPGGTRIEVIEPLTDAGPYHDALLAHGDADHVHHIRLAETDVDQVREHLGSRGLPVVFDATFASGAPDTQGLHGQYWDTTGELGFLLEVAKRPEGFVMPTPVARYEVPESDRQHA
jgi:methylmalonyl-CoA/ethylmalonyl-CoA epimerase